MRTLHSRLLVMIALLLVVVLGVAGFLSSRVTRGEIRRLSVESSVSHVEIDPVAKALGESYATAGSFASSKAILDGGAAGTVDYVLAGPNGAVLARSDELAHSEIDGEPDGRLQIAGERDGARFRVRIDRPHAVIRDRDGGEVGRLYWIERPGDMPVPEAIALRIDRFLLLIFAVAALASIALAWAIARRLAAPLERLTVAVRRLEAGDLSARVDVEGRDEIGDLARAFNSMTSALSRNEQMRRRMVSDVAHELRTPLTNIIGQLEAIEDGLLPPDNERISSLHDDAVRLAAIVGDLQDLAVADAGGLRLEHRRLDADRLAREIVAGAEGSAAARGITLEVRSAGSAHLDGDETRLLQVLRNLVENALEHTPAGGRVDVDVTSSLTEVRISVRDSGVGLPSAELENIFERFYRLDASRSRRTGGTGLGLAIARQLAEAQGGTLRAESAGEGKGAVFTLVLPAARPSS